MLLWYIYNQDSPLKNVTIYFILPWDPSDELFSRVTQKVISLCFLKVLTDTARLPSPPPSSPRKDTGKILHLSTTRSISGLLIRMPTEGPLLFWKCNFGVVMLSFIQHCEHLNWIYYVSFWPFYNRRSTLKAYKKADIYIHIYIYIFNFVLLKGNYLHHKKDSQWRDAFS